MNLSIGSDHAGYAYKEAIRAALEHDGHVLTDHGVHSTDRADYPDYAVLVANDVAAGRADFGVLVCGSGIGVSITANKIAGIRAANCVTVEMASLARQHNNANVVCTGERLVDEATAIAIVNTFLATAFEGGRHTDRVAKIHTLTGC
ncbi:MAG: ribose 5-phosphate isomerase B [Candidatus Kapabacteria bacterium]|nr:ribose 5-phosphate isomerase B [Candidatus Kapabacteria bacterium]